MPLHPARETSWGNYNLWSLQRRRPHLEMAKSLSIRERSNVQPSRAGWPRAKLCGLHRRWSPQDRRSISRRWRKVVVSFDSAQEGERSRTVTVRHFNGLEKRRSPSADELRYLGSERRGEPSPAVIPAKAGIHCWRAIRWVPAFAGDDR